MQTEIFKDSAENLNSHLVGDEKSLPARLESPMDALILLIGEHEFLETFMSRYRHLVTYAAEVSSTGEAIALLQKQKQKPNVLLVQANALTDSGDYKKLKQQPNCGGLYCLVIEDSSPLSLNSSERIVQLERQAQALENGADVCLKIAITEKEKAKIKLEQRLLRAQIQVGVNQSKQYHNLIQTNDVLSAIALADPLTETSNRRALEWELPRQIQNARRHKTPLSLIMLDVDYFKSVNDNHGHLVGDRVLQMLTARLRDRLRLQDTIFRYGGEEFAVLLQQTDAEAARFVAERLRQGIGQNPFPLDRNLTLAITISLGLAELCSTDDPQGQSLLARADNNLLKAKTGGRNQAIGG